MKLNGMCGAVVAATMLLPAAGTAMAQQSRQGQDQARTQRQAQTGQAGHMKQSHQHAMSGQTERSTQQLLASDVKLGNEAEIQFSQLGQKQAENQDVKQYAQEMIQAHQKLNQQLVQAVPQARQANLEGGSALSGQANRAANAGDQDQPQAGQVGQDVYGMAGGADQVQTLTRIHQQVAQKMLDQQKQMLQDKQGAQFDKAFMGCQIGLHQAMLAKLQVYQEHVSGDAQQALQQAEQATRQHLEQAKQIMEQLADAS